MEVVGSIIHGNLRMIDFAKRITVAENVLVRELDGEAVLLNLDNESYYGLDDVGTMFWTVLSHSSSIDEAYQRLLKKEFDVEDRTRLRQKLGEAERFVQRVPMYKVSYPHQYRALPYVCHFLKGHAGIAA